MKFTILPFSFLFHASICTILLSRGRSAFGAVWAVGPISAQYKQTVSPPPAASRVPVSVCRVLASRRQPASAAAQQRRSGYEQEAPKRSSAERKPGSGAALFPVVDLDFATSRSLGSQAPATR